MRPIVAGFGLALFLAACPAPPACPPPPRAPAPAAAKPPMVPDPKRDIPSLPYNSAIIHVDTAFTPEERAHIRNAATAWNLLSQGQVRLVTVDDLDFSAAEGVRDGHRIVKIADSKHSTLADMVDAQHTGYTVLAFLLPVVHPWADRKVYILADRVSPDQFPWVVTHELGHVLGLDDLQETGHIMSGVGRFRRDWFTPADLRECQAAKVCK